MGEKLLFGRPNSHQTAEMPRTHAAHDALGRIVLEDGLARMKAAKSVKSKYITVTAKAINEDSEIEDPDEVMDEFPSNPTGVRFCRVCKDFKPIERFSQGRKRFTCEAHLVVRPGSGFGKRHHLHVGKGV